MQTCYLAVDIGASSGRHIIGTVEHGVMALHEVYRFENRLIEKNGHLCWDMEGLVQNVIEGLKAAHDAGYTPTTVGIDTWAVDFLLLDADGTPIGDPVAYRDGRTAAMREELEPILPFTKLYARTGIQYQSFNTVYQLCALKKEHPEQLAAAEHFLMVPDYLNYRLTGVMANEYTNASTTALVGAISKDWDDEIINRLGLPRKIFGRISTPGTKLGNLSSAVKTAPSYCPLHMIPAPPFWLFPQGMIRPFIFPAAHGACWVWKTKTPSRPLPACRPILPTRAAMNTATVTLRTLWACG